MSAFRRDSGLPPAGTLEGQGSTLCSRQWPDKQSRQSASCQLQREANPSVSAFQCCVAGNARGSSGVVVSARAQSLYAPE